MAQQTINIGTTANDGTGDPLRTAFDKVNDNFTELYNDDAGDVDSVNGATGVVVLDSDDISEGSTNLYNQTHTGDVTGSTALTIANNAVTAAKLANDIRGVQYVGIDTGDYIEFTADTQMDFYVNALNQMRLEADGDLHVEGDVIAASTTVSSDENLKKDISTYKNALKTISELKGVSFSWKSNGKKSGGVIAQDVEKVLPELVGTKKSMKKEGEETLTVDYNGLIGVLIQAVKELSHKIEKLEKR